MRSPIISELCLLIVKVVSLIGTLDKDAPHLHIVVSDDRGVVTGGHLLEGSTVRTTLEVVFGELTDLTFGRGHCPKSGYDELVIQQREATATDKST